MKYTIDDTVAEILNSDSASTWLKESIERGMSARENIVKVYNEAHVLLQVLDHKVRNYQTIQSLKLRRQEG